MIVNLTMEDKHIKATFRAYTSSVGFSPYGQFCPIANVLKEHFPLISQIQVTDNCVIFKNYTKKVSIDLDDKAKKFIKDFDFWFLNKDVDAYRKVRRWFFRLFYRLKPIDFSLDVPESLWS